MISSSAILEICIEHAEQAYKKSITKSLSETVSIEFFVGLLKPNFFDDVERPALKACYQCYK